MKARIGIVALLALLLIALLRPVASQDGRAELERRVDRTIREFGTVESAKSVGIVNQLEGEATILWLTSDGTAVEKGDLLATLDDSKLQEERTQVQLELQAARAALDQAKLRIASAKAAAGQFQNLQELKLKVAELNRKKHLEKDGVFAVTLRSAERDADLAENRKKLVASLIERSKQAPGGVPHKDLETLQFEAEKAGMELAKSRDRIELMTTLEQPYQTALLELAVAQAKGELLKQRQDSQAATQKAEADFEAAKLEENRVATRLKHTEDQLAKCRISAPASGIVLYSNSASRRSTTSTIEQGANVEEHQPIMQIVDVSKLRMRVEVHESRIERVKKGQTAQLHFDALPNQTLKGKVLSVNKTPEPDSWFSSDVKTYAVYVSIDGPVDKLKLGLSALVEIDAPK